MGYNRAGQIPSLAINLLQRGSGAFLVYDKTNRETWAKLKDTWYREVLEKGD